MFDVAIIGCGPVGAMAANFLGKAGLKTLVLEKEANPYPLPRAVHLDHEMMRLFQDADVIDDVRADMRDTEGHLHIGADKGVIRYMGNVGKPRPFSWANDYFFYQPELEDHLRGALAKYSNVDLRLGSEFLALQQNDGKVTLDLKNSEGTYQETARWVIACDGSRSLVRKSLDIQLDDLQFEEPWLVVDVEADGDVKFPELKDVPEEANLQSLSVMMCDPKRPLTIVPGRGNHRRWELMLLPGEDDQEMMQPEKVAELIGPYLDGVPHKMIRASTYRFHGLIAEQWQSGNVFLAGDAAHQTPPFFGQGMCHGLRDVSNLAWKMALIAKDKAPESLLSTYQPERDPHVRAVISAAVETGRYICVLDEEKAAIRDAEIREKAKQKAIVGTAADLIPAISTGIVSLGTENAGRRFIQPFVQVNGEQKRLDDVLTGSWKLFVKNQDAAEQATALIKTQLPYLDLCVCAIDSLEDNNALSDWLDNANANAVLIRPDFYVFGTASDDLSSLLKTLDTQLQNATVKMEKTA